MLEPRQIREIEFEGLRGKRKEKFTAILSEIAALVESTLSENNTVKAANVELSNTQAMLEARLAELEKDNGEMTVALANTRTILTADEEKIAALSAELSQTAPTLKEAQAKLSEIQQKLSDTQDKLAQSQTKLIEMTELVKHLQENGREESFNSYLPMVNRPKTNGLGRPIGGLTSKTFSVSHENSTDDIVGRAKKQAAGLVEQGHREYLAYIRRGEDIINRKNDEFQNRMKSDIAKLQKIDASLRETKSKLLRICAAMPDSIDNGMPDSVKQLWHNLIDLDKDNF